MTAQAPKSGQEARPGKPADLAQEIARYSEMLALDPKSRVFALLAETFRKGGRYGEAISTAAEGLKHHPFYLSGRVALARAYFDDGQTDAARREFEKVIAAAPDNLLAHRMLADICLNEGRLSEAAKSLRMVVLLDPTDERSREKLRSIAGEVSVTIEEEKEMEPLIDRHRYDELPSGRAPAAAPAPPAESLETMTDQEMLQKPELMAEESAAPARGKEETPAPPPASYGELQAEQAGEVFAADSPAAPRADEFQTEIIDWEKFMGEVETPGEPPPELNTETLAEIYVQQGFYEKALGVYQAILADRPGDGRLMDKCEELKSILAMAGVPPLEKVPEAAAAAPSGELGEEIEHPARPSEEAKLSHPAESEALATLRLWLERLKTEKR